MRRVAITGIGLVTGLGSGTEPTWRGLLEGRSAVGPISSFDASSLQTQIGAEVRDLDASQYVARPRSLRMMTRADRLGFCAAIMALRDSALDIGPDLHDRTAVYAGGNKEISETMLTQAATAALDGGREPDMVRFASVARETAYPLFYVEGLPAACLFFLSEALGVRGPNTYFSGGAEAGAMAIAAAWRAIRRGDADFALAGGYDDAVSWWNLTKLDGLGILSDRNDLGPSACRPFDLGRTGTVLGEGAAFLALEPLATARERGAHIYAELAGVGSAMDANAVITPAPDGRGLAAATAAALRAAGAGPGAVDAVIAHGSATPAGDMTEVRGLEAALGPRAAELPATSVKPATGHLTAAAGALNFAVGALALRDGLVPATLNLEHPDPQCRMDWVRKSPRRLPLGNVLAVARGFEGQSVVASLVSGGSA